jgi:hypothetical protein
MAGLFSCNWEDQQQEFLRCLTKWITNKQCSNLRCLYGIPGLSMVIKYWKRTHTMEGLQHNGMRRMWEGCRSLLSSRRELQNKTEYQPVVLPVALTSVWMWRCVLSVNTSHQQCWQRNNAINELLLYWWAH